MPSLHEYAVTVEFKTRCRARRLVQREYGVGPIHRASRYFLVGKTRSAAAGRASAAWSGGAIDMDAIV